MKLPKKCLPLFEQLDVQNINETLLQSIEEIISINSVVDIKEQIKPYQLKLKEEFFNIISQVRKL
ncbi:hypothetical protein AB8613_23945 [Vibrio sp. BS-M-Sm-2]|uniref:hypothetical protein n=1 Tax=Vibrio sp. BS-M-Sm-2 TaxID=3241167 RepID=UPI003556E925